MRFTRVRALPVVLIGLVGSAIVALQSPAEAAVTSSNITSPVNGAHYLITDASPASLVTLSGTSDGTTGDLVDIRCYTQAHRWQTGPSDVPVAANGTFSTNISTDMLYGTCRLRAVPADLPAASSAAAFTGPKVTTEWLTSEKVSAGPNAGKTHDYYVLFQGSHAMNDYVSASGGGLWDSRLQYSDGTSSDYLWYGNAGLYGNEDGTRSYLQVDGRNAYGPDSAASLFTNNPGLPALTFTASRNAVTGVTTIRETNPIVVCPNEAPFPPTAGSCPQYNSAGVRLERTITTDDGGRQVHIKDIWRSTDGQPHAVSAHYSQYVEGRDYSTGSAVTTQVGLRLPWLGGFQTYTSPTTLSGTTKAPNTVFVRDSNTAPNGSTQLPRGAVTFDVAPGTVRRDSNAEFRLNDSFTVPAGKTTVVRQDFVMGTTEAEIAAKAAASVVRLNPFRSDGLIKKKGAKAYVGNGRYNTSGVGQTVTARTKRARTTTFLINVQNDGTRTTSFKLKGAGAKAGFSVAYLKGASGRTAITKAVTRGNYVLRNLAPGASRTIRLVVVVKPGTRIGAVKSWLVLATSTNDGTSKDAVKAKVHVVK